MIFALFDRDFRLDQYIYSTNDLSSEAGAATALKCVKTLKMS